MRGFTRLLLLAVIAGLPLQSPAPIQRPQQSYEQPALRVVQWAPAYSCCTARGRCPLPAPQPIGSPCQCYGDPGNAC
jgi:hypothetical protein